jgi:hypothetical protein
LIILIYEVVVITDRSYYTFKPLTTVYYYSMETPDTILTNRLTTTVYHYSMETPDTILPL